MPHSPFLAVYLVDRYGTLLSACYVSYAAACASDTSHLSMDGTCYAYSVAYPQLVSGGVSESHKSKWLVKVGVGMGVTP